MWEPSAFRPDPVAILEAEARTRVPELVPIRYQRMLASPFAFFRGGAGIMAADLAATPVSGIRVQCCGDAHLANFGGYASPERTLVFDINDFDETCPGPWEWDVKRLATSFVIAARDRGLDDENARSLSISAVRSYREAMRSFAAMPNLEVWYSRLDASSLMERWGTQLTASGRARFERNVAKAKQRDSSAELAKLTEIVDGVPRIVSDPPLLMRVEDILSGPDVDRMVEQLHDHLRSYRKSLPRDRRLLLESFRFVDAARKVVGVGSVGTRAWIMLLLGRDDRDPLFLQIKESGASVLEPFVGRSKYARHGQRVVEGQRLMQAATDIFLGWERGIGADGEYHDFYVRQLRDWKLSPNLERMEPEGFRVFTEMCGWTLARAHARSGDRIAIAAYLGAGSGFDEAVADFAGAYADQNERDHTALVAAAGAGRVAAAT